MKINRSVVRKNYNDCWCTAISKALEIDYDKVYKDFKLFKHSKGGMDLKIIEAYLKNKDYEAISVDLDLKAALFIYNTKENAHTIFSLITEDEENAHIIYVKDMIIYDDIKDFEYDEFVNQYNVNMVFVKKQ